MNRSGPPLSLCLTLLSLILTFAVSPAPAQTGRAPLDGELPAALEGLDIRDGYMPAGGFARAGVVHALQGTLVVVHRGDRQAYVASRGDPVHENDELFTLADSRCRVRFVNEDVVDIAPETRFSVERFMDRPRRGEKTSLFGLLKGKAMFYALRLFRYRDARFEVETPTAVVGVRGTQFGVHVFQLEGDRADSRRVRVAAGTGGIPTYLAQAGEGEPDTGTIVACGDGQLDVKHPRTGQRIALVSPNQAFNTVTGRTTFDPQNRTLNGIAADTEVREGGGAGAGGGPAGAAPQPGAREEETPVTGEETPAATPTDLTDLTTDVNIQQTGDETQQAEETQPRDQPSRHFGYFNGILSRSLGGSPLTGGYYFTDGITNLDETGTARGMREGADVGTMSYDGAGAPGIKSVTGLTHLGNTVDSGVPVDVDYWVYGHDAYMVWGTWTAYYKPPMIDTDTGIEHSFDYRGYYFVGDHTTDNQMAALRSGLGEVTYSGNAWGKHYQQPAGTAMEGSFTAQVDFSSPSVTDFDMSVSGGGHSASITDVQGGFTGSSSQFVLDTGTGSWHVDGAPAVYKDARGGLYGDQAQKMGVIWSLKESSVHNTNTAWGMCVGER
jgi:hypothetical protein